MKKLSILALMLCLASSSAMAQQEKPAAAEGYKFTIVKENKSTPIKDQSRSGTCWCYSTVAFIESEILRHGGEELDLSEMWIVRNIYFEKAKKYVRLHGHLNLAVGGAAADVIHGIKTYGIVPEEVYAGFNYGTPKADFVEIDHVIKAYCDAVIAGQKLTTAWERGLLAIFDAYFGTMPEKFTYKGKEYTPMSYAKSLPINIDDYVCVSSLTHHPFYSQFVLEVPDNWAWSSSYNVPMDEMMRIIDATIDGGGTVAWGTDISEKGFSRTKAVAVVPEENIESLGGTEAERWGKQTEAERMAALYSFDKPVKEKKITQQMRQEAYDNYLTTDDHGMQIVGTATDQEGNPFYKVKNSWDVRPPYDGYFYFSRPFVEYKTLTIIVDKNTIPTDILKKMGLQSSSDTKARKGKR